MKNASESLETQASPVPDSGPRLAPRFPFVDLKAQFQPIREAVMAAITRVLESQQFILGDEIESFEKEVGALLGVREAVSCASGTAALEISLRALGIGSGDEVMTTPYTFVATAGAIAWTGARPVFVDIEPETFNMDPRLLDSALTPKTRAIVPVHLFGCCASMKSILQFAREKRLWVIEDTAQAIGARYDQAAAGTLGDVACFSFFPSKNLGAAGDGGMVVSNDPGLAGRLRLIRNHGSRRKYDHEILGTNSRLDALQAAILRVKLGSLSVWTAKRQERAARYHELFADRGLERHLSLPHAPPGRTHVFNQYVIRCHQRDNLRAFLNARGIPTEIYYPVALHLQPAFSYLGYTQGNFPCAEAASAETLALPVYPELDDERQNAVVGEIAEFYRLQR